MFKSVPFTKAVCLTTIYAFAFAIMPKPVHARIGLAPLSFSEMYSRAQNGEVEALRASVHRGMDIDTVNSNGDTGLCIAARRHEVYTYNSFRAAGANPRHPCTQNISDYNEFVRRSDVIGLDGTSRAAYAAMGDKETYRISPAWWWIGGAVVAGGVLLLLLGGKHGGGGGGSGSSNKSEDYFSLGANIATKGKALKTTKGTAENSSLQRHANENIEKIVNINLQKKALSNTEYMDAILFAKNGGSYTNLADTLLDTGVGTAAMVALKNSTINNNGYIKIDSYNASVGMVASEGSTAANYGTGIITSGSDALDNSNGIRMNFSGYKDNDAIVGMYADTKSTITNHGDISGTAIQASKDPLADEEENAGKSSGLSYGNMGNSGDQSESETEQTTANTGALIGMEAMILNVGKNLNQDLISMVNTKTGKIYLSAGDNGDSDNEIKVQLVGMGSFLDNAFLNGSHIISRAENVKITNNGNINLSYTGNYTSSSDKSLRKGTGGIVGIRSDANTNATNNGTIKIILNDEYQNNGVSVAAGMQSVHGGNVVNNGNIRITTPTGNNRINYGMMAVEGSGANSSLYTNLHPQVINSGNINIQVSNSFGMASFVGGTVHNSGNITIGSEETRFNNNIALYGFGDTQKTDLQNTGTIDIYSHKSIAMQNDYAGGTDIINNGVVNIHESAKDSYVFGGSYSRIFNDNTINYDATSSTQENPASDGTTYDPFKNYKPSVGISIISTKARSIKTDAVDFSSSTTEGIYNNENAVINMNGSSFVAAMAVEKNDNASNTQAKAYNYGTIEIKDRASQNATNSIGMYLDSYTLNNSGIFNHGTIKTSSRFSSAMVSESLKNADVVNSGTIETNKEYSLGIYSSDYSNIRNSGNIALNDKNSVGIQIGKVVEKPSSNNYYYPQIINEKSGTITVGSKGNLIENSFGIFAGSVSVSGTAIAAQIENSGIITLYTKNAGAGIYSTGISAKITNQNLINVFGNDSSGIHNTGSATITNEIGAIINVGSEEENVSNSYAIYNTGSGKITNKGTINLYNKDKGYAIYSTGDADIKNEGDINLYNEKSTAIYASAGSITNSTTININNDYSTAFEISGTATMLNDKNGIINVGSESKAVSHSNGIIATDESEGTITNQGTINLYNDADGDGNSHAILAGGNVTVINDTDAHINSYNDNSSAILATLTATIKNNGTMTVLGNQVYAILGQGENNVLSAENAGIITVGQEGADNYVGYGIAAQTINYIKNNGTIIVYNYNGYGISARESSGSGTDNGIFTGSSSSIQINGENSVGIYGGAVANIENNGTIFSSQENSKAIETNTVDSEITQTVKNNNTLFLVNANNSYGIYAQGITNIINTKNGRISVGYTTSDATNGHGIYAIDAASISNNANIDVYASSASGISGGVAISNGGNISIFGDNSYGIYGATNNTSINNSGSIKVNQAQNSAGIYSNGETSIISSGENKTITVGTDDETSANNAHGIYAVNASSISNTADINVYASWASGISGGGSITSSGDIYVRGDNSNGIYGATNNTAITNSGSITIDHAQNSAGIYSKGETTISNSGENKNIMIGVGDTDLSTEAHGIYALSASSISNDMNINVYASSASGISGGEKITNSGDIYILGENSNGIYGAANNTTINNSGGITVVNAQNSAGIYSKGTEGVTINNTNPTNQNSLTTTKQIIIGNTFSTPDNAYGIRVDSNAKKIVNEMPILVYATNSYGIYSQTKDSQTISNSGFISLNLAYATGIYGYGNTTLTNDAPINIYVADNGYGIKIEGGTSSSVTNNKDANITIGDSSSDAVGGHGIYVVNAGNILNYAPINVYASDSTGIYTEKASKIENSGFINLPQGNRSIGIYSEGTPEIINNKNAYIIIGTEDDNSADDAHGIYSPNASSITNYEYITVYGSGSAITGGSSVTNSGKLSVSGANSKGISANGSVTNSGSIYLDNANNSYGIYSTGNNAVISNNDTAATITLGSIDASPVANKAAGIYATGSSTSITNLADISVHATNGIGIYGKDAQTINNSGALLLTKSFATGIETHGSTNITNENAITLWVAEDGYGIYSKDGTSSVTNKADGVITLGDSSSVDNEVNGFGIYVEKANKIDNSAPIYVYASQSAAIYNPISANEIINSGYLMIEHAENSYGIYSNGTGTVTNTNTISLGDPRYTETYGNGIYAPNSSALSNSGQISIFAGNSTALTGHNNVTNEGTLLLPMGTANTGIFADGSTKLINKQGGTISISGANNSYGIRTTGTSTIDNQATITLGIYETGASSAFGIHSTNASQITNSGNISVHAANSAAIYSKVASKISNSGSLLLTQNSAVGIDSEGQTQLSNSGPINLYVAGGGYGIRSTGNLSTIQNSANGSITLGSASSPSSYAAYGIHAANASSLDNYANISVYSASSYGIYADTVSSITNYSGQIYVSGDNSYGIYSAKGDTTVNISGGTIYLGNANNSSGIYIADSKATVTNSGGNIIIGSSESSGGSGNYGIYVYQGTVNHSGNITIYGNGTGIYGNNKTAITAKNISINGSGTAINRATTATVSEGGTLSVSSGDGIIASGKVDNFGTITVTSGRGIVTDGAVTNATGALIVAGGTAVQDASSLENSGGIFGNTSTNAAVYNVDTVKNAKNSTISNDFGYAIRKSNTGTLTIENEGTISSSDTAIYNYSGTLNVTNGGTIKVTGSGHGIYNRGATNITNDSTITIAGSGNGIYVVVPTYTTPVTVTNNGTISVNTGHAIFIDKEYSFSPIINDQGEITGYYPSGDATDVPADAYIRCTGSICVVPSNTSPASMQPASVQNSTLSSLIAVNDAGLSKSVSLLNMGTIKTSGNVDFGTQSVDDVQISIGDGGSYQAESFTGTIKADTSIVNGGFETTYVNEDSFVGENDGIQVLSQSYMFDADTQENENGNTDVVMTMKPFEETVDDTEIADYLQQNYNQEHGEQVFNTLKTAQTKEQLEEYLHKELGLGMLPNLAKQSLDIEKTVAANVTDDLLNTDNESTRYVMNMLAYKNDVKAKGDTDGYKDKVMSMYGFADKAIGNSMRFGFGLEAVRSDSDFDGGSSRYNNMVEFFAPIIFDKGNLKALVKPKAGFARGHYRRTAVDNVYKAKTKEYYYGADSSIKQSIDLNLFEAEPEAGFNVTGLYIDDVHENNGGLKIKDKNILSAQSVLGLTAKRRFAINNKSGITMGAGAKYFHEFGKKYKNRATVADMIGYYDIVSNRFQRDYGLVSLKAQYDYLKLTLDASANIPMEEKRNPYYLFNVKYKF